MSIDPFAPNKPGDRGAQFFRHFKDNRTIHRVLLPHPDDWESYYEHVVNGRAHPCTRKAGNCPGCTWTGYADRDGNITEDTIAKGQRAKKRYVVPVIPYDLDGPQPPVWWKYGVGIVMDLEAELEQNPEDLTKVDIGILKDGVGMLTSYKVSVLQKRRDPIDTEASLEQLRNRQSVRDTLQQMFTEVWGEWPNINPEPAPPPTRKGDNAPIPDPDPWAATAPPDWVPPTGGYPEPEPPADPWDADPPADTVTYSVDQIRGMSRAQLVAVCLQAGIVPPPEAVSDSEIADLLIARFTG